MEQQNQQQVTLTLDVNTLNVILAGLDELPAKISRRVQDDIIKQAKEQLENNKIQES